MTQSVQATGEGSLSPGGRRIDNWVEHVLGAGYRRYCPGGPWAPAINLYESDTQYCLVADLAGIAADEIDIRVEGGSLILSGARLTPKPPKSCGRVRVHLMEIDHGRFCRQVELPKDADVSDVEAINATYRCGLLWVQIPKKP